MATIKLDVHDPNQVSSAQVLESQLGDPGRRLLIFGGIAIPSFGAQEGDTNRETVIVNLRTPVARKPLDREWSATVGLASIGNTESEFIFATDAVSLDVDPVSRELLLVCNVAVQGDDSGLNRFSYELNVLVEEVETELGALLVSNLEPSGGLGGPPGPPVYGPSAVVAGGNVWGGRVLLTLPAPGSGVFVDLSSGDPSTAAVPVSVPVLGGHTSGDFTAPAVGFVLRNTDVTITASLKGVQRTATVTVLAPPR
jgi:hypothetical protein